MSCGFACMWSDFVRFCVICGKMFVILLFGTNVIHFRRLVQKKRFVV